MKQKADTDTDPDPEKYAKPQMGADAKIDH
jgi:hypothetical protein